MNTGYMVSLLLNVVFIGMSILTTILAWRARGKLSKARKLVGDLYDSLKDGRITPAEAELIILDILEILEG